MRLAGLLKRLPYFFRALKVAAVCLLVSHATAFSQGTAASAGASSASAATSAIALPKTIPFKQDSASSSGGEGPPLTAITAILALGFAGFAIWIWRNRRPTAGVDAAKRSSWWGGASSRDVLLHGATRLSPKHSVHDIEWRGRRLLIGCTDQAMTLLSEHAVVESSASTAGQNHPVPTQPEGAT